MCCTHPRAAGRGQCAASSPEVRGQCAKSPPEVRDLPAGGERKENGVMPCIQWKTNEKITPAQEAELRSALGEAIALIPGKSEQWLMLTFEPECRMAFRGNGEEPAAFIAVDIYGHAPAQTYDKLTARLCGLAQSVLGIAPDHTYVRYLETEHWGWNGGNF